MNPEQRALARVYDPRLAQVFLAALLTVVVYLGSLDAPSMADLATPAALAAVAVGAVLGVVSVAVERRGVLAWPDLGTRAFVVLLLVVAAAGVLLLPDGLPDAVWIGLLAGVWSSTLVRVTGPTGEPSA